MKQGKSGPNPDAVTKMLWDTSSRLRQSRSQLQGTPDGDRVQNIIVG